LDLQGFIVGKKFIVKEVAMLKKRNYSLSLYVYMPWNFLTKSEKYCAFWVIAYHHGLRWNDSVQHETPDYDGCNWCGRR